MADPRKLAQDLVRDLRAQIGERLRAAALFGSAARGEWVGGVSDVNVLVLLDDIDAAVLARAADTVRAATSRGVTPLLLELDEWRRAADVFAIELADMHEAHVPLTDSDPVASHVVEPVNLRLQAEHELRGKLLHLHGGMLVAAQDPRRLGALLVHALPSFVTYLRTALRLAGQSVPGTMRAVIEDGCTLVDAQPAAFLRVLDARNAGGRLEIGMAEPVTDQFNTAAKMMAGYIDAFGR